MCYSGEKKKECCFYEKSTSRESSIWSYTIILSYVQVIQSFHSICSNIRIRLDNCFKAIISYLLRQLNVYNSKVAPSW